MIQNNNLVKKLFVYGDIRYFSDYKDKLIKHFIKCLLFTRKVYSYSNNQFFKKDKSSLKIIPQSKLLKAKSQGLTHLPELPLSPYCLRLHCVPPKENLIFRSLWKN